MYALTRVDQFVRKFAFVLVFVPIGVLVFWIYRNTFPTNNMFALYYSPFERLADCMTGVFLFFVVNKLIQIQKMNRIIWTSIELAVVGLVMLTHWFAPTIIPKFLWDAYFILPWTGVIAIFSLSRGYVSSILSWKPLELLGSISLEFFLVHSVALRWVYMFLSQKIVMTSLQMGILSFFISLWASIVIHFLLVQFFKLPDYILLVIHKNMPHSTKGLAITNRPTFTTKSA